MFNRTSTHIIRLDFIRRRVTQVPARQFNESAIQKARVFIQQCYGTPSVKEV